MRASLIALLGCLGAASCGLIEDRVVDPVLDRVLERPSGPITLPPPPPSRLARPVFVVVDGDRLVVEMDDGAQCIGGAGGTFSAAGWTGQLTECPYTYSYAVALAAGSPAGALELGEVTGPVLPAAEGEVPFRPLATAQITDTSGFTYRYESAAGF